MMAYRDEVQNEYFEWMVDIVCGRRYAKGVSYRRLLTLLHNTEFIYSIRRDADRAGDGINLRYRFTLVNDYEDALEYLNGPCSVLEMMIALAIHCEENIMDDPNVGDRTGQWFWGMIVNLGLGSMTDDMFDRQEAEYIVDRFLYREYEPDGKGGLFTIRDCEKDLRKVEIWHQLCWYLGSMV